MHVYLSNKLAVLAFVSDLSAYVHVCIGLRIPCGSQFFLYTWVSVIKIRSPGAHSKHFNCWAVLPAQEPNVLLQK